MLKLVYLDTQDYIKAFNESDNGPNRTALRELAEFRKGGKVNIGYSFVTMIEFITKPDAQNRKERILRGQLVKEVCGNNAFPPLHELVDGAKFPNNGHWFSAADEKMLSADKFRNKLLKTWRETLQDTSGLNRQARRRLARKPSMQELVRNMGSAWGSKREDWGDFPVSEELLRTKLLQRFMAGSCSDREFEVQVNAWVFDPAEYSKIVYDYADQLNVIEKFFGENIAEISEAVRQMQAAVATIKEVNHSLLEKRTDLIALGLSKVDAKALTGQFKIPSVNEEKLSAKLESKFGKGKVGHFGRYLAHITNTEHRFKPSNVMDLMQMCYAYECDYFRCDKAMASIFKDYPPFQGKLVSSLSELLSIVRSQIP